MNSSTRHAPRLLPPCMKPVWFLALWAVFGLAGYAPAARAMQPSPSAPDSAVAAPDTSATAPVPQIDIFDVLNRYILKREVKPELEGTTRTGLSWSILPSISYNPVYGASFGVSATGAGKRGSTEAKYSSISISGNVATSGQVQAQVRGDVFSPSGKFLTKGDFRYLDTQRSTWGLGPFEESQPEYPMDYKLYRAYATVYRRVNGPVFAGIGFHYDAFAEIVDEFAQNGETTPFTTYSGGAVSRTVSSGFSLNVLSDTRDNLVNASSGHFLSFSLRDYGKGLGSDVNWQEMWTEMRVYPHFPRESRNVLAFWLYGWMSFGHAPYLNLPANGWDTYGRGARGYLAGRIRGSSQLYLETEYRMVLTRNGLFGAVVFLNLTGTTEPVTGIIGRTDLGYGTGLRVKFNKRSAANLAVDLAWGRDQVGRIFFGLSEAY